jgi:hypothetical protein
MKTLIAFIVSGLVLAPAASATSKEQEQIRKLRDQVVGLKARNKALVSANIKLRDQATLLGSQLGWAQTTASSLAENVRDRTSERDSLQKYINGIPSELQRAVEQVREEVAYTRYISNREGRLVRDEYLISLATMNYVVGHVTAPAYGYRNELASMVLPWDAETALFTQAGLCGNAAWTFAVIVKQLGVQVRSAEFYFSNGIDNHIAAETYYGGDWHYFDPTWGLTFSSGSDVLSLTEARDGQSHSIRYDQNLLWYLTAPTSLIDEIPLLRDPSTRVEFAKVFS